MWLGYSIRLKKRPSKIVQKNPKRISYENISNEQILEKWILKFGLILPSLSSMEFIPQLNFFPQKEKKGLRD